MLQKITHALTGFFLIFVLFFGVSLPAEAQAVADVCDFGPCAFTLEEVDLQNLDRQGIVALLTTISTYLIFIAGPIVVLAVIVGGLFLIFGKGEEGWNLIKNSLIGLVIIVLSFSIVSIVTQVLI